MTQYQTIVVEVADGVATVTLNRPEAKNVFNRRMGYELGHAFSLAEEDDAVRAIVVTGAGTVFCGGADISGPTVGGGDGEPIDGRPAVGELKPWQMSTPVIAAINGSAVGVGLTYPMLWDIRIVARDARLGFVFNRRGLTPEANSLWLLPRLVGTSRALELLITGRMFDGNEALAIGFATEALERDQVLPRAMAIARDIAENTAPTSVALTKKLLYKYLEEDDRMAARVEELGVFQWATQQADAKEGIQAFFQKRAPKWSMSKTKDLPDAFR
jgi:enoyl-CoA hydratase/carnithine racemase